MVVTIDASIKQVIPHCRLGYIVTKNVTIGGTHPALSQEFLKLQSEVAKIYNLDMLPTLPRIISVRNMYKKLDFDPSRYRPASEALVRRVLQNKGLYYVNSAVDVNNYCSIKFLLPFGLYDYDQIKGEPHYTIAHNGNYMNIVGSTVSTDNKPFLMDDEGVFGNPTSDSRRTAVTLNTHNLLSVIYADEEVTDDVLLETLNFTAKMIVYYNGGETTDKSIVYP